MTRTTIDIDSDVLAELKLRKEKLGKPLGVVASTLLAKALAEEAESEVDDHAGWKWHSQPMGALVDIDDKEAVASIVDGEKWPSR